MSSQQTPPARPRRAATTGNPAAGPSRSRDGRESAGLHRALRPTRWGVTGPAPMFASGIGLAGTVALVAFPFMGLLVLPEGARLHEWAGLAQRILVIGVILPARVALAAQLLRMRPTG